MSTERKKQIEKRLGEIHKARFGNYTPEQKKQLAEEAKALANEWRELEQKAAVETTARRIGGSETKAKPAEKDKPVDITTPPTSTNVDSDLETTAKDLEELATKETKDKAKADANKHKVETPASPESTPSKSRVAPESTTSPATQATQAPRTPQATIEHNGVKYNRNSAFARVNELQKQPRTAETAAEINKLLQFVQSESDKVRDAYFEETGYARPGDFSLRNIARATGNFLAGKTREDNTRKKIDAKTRDLRETLEQSPEGSPERARAIHNYLKAVDATPKESKKGDFHVLRDPVIAPILAEELGIDIGKPDFLSGRFRPPAETAISAQIQAGRNHATASVQPDGTPTFTPTKWEATPEGEVKGLANTLEQFRMEIDNQSVNPAALRDRGAVLGRLEAELAANGKPLSSEELTKLMSLVKGGHDSEAVERTLRELYYSRGGTSEALAEDIPPEDIPLEDDDPLAFDESMPVAFDESIPFEDTITYTGGASDFSPDAISTPQPTQTQGQVVEPLPSDYLNPLRADLARRQAAAASDPMRSDPLLNFQQQEAIQAEKEQTTLEYASALKDLMDRSERQSFAKNIMRALGQIAAGTIGLVAGLDVSKYYDPGEASDPADYYNQLEPMLTAKHNEQQIRYSELSQQYAGALEYYLQTTELAKVIANAEQNHMGQNMQWLSLQMDYNHRLQELHERGQVDTAKDMAAIGKQINEYYNPQLETAESEIKEAREGLKGLQTSVSQAFRDDEGLKSLRTTVANINSGRAVQESGWKWETVRRGFAGSQVNLNLLDTTHRQYMESGMTEAAASKKLVAELNTYVNTNPATYLNTVVTTKAMPPADVENIAKYNLLHKTFFGDSPSPLDGEYLNATIQRLAEAKIHRDALLAERNQVMQSYMGGQSFQNTPAGVRTSQASAVRPVPVAPAAPPAGHPLSVEFMNPSTGRNDMSQFRVAGTQGRTWVGLDARQVAADRGVLRGKDYYLPHHVTSDPEFLNAVGDAATEIGVEPSGLLSIMALETDNSFHPARVNGIGATGLIQFIPTTAQRLLNAKLRDAEGNPVRLSPSQAQAYMASLGRKEQLEYVVDYFRATKRDAGIPENKQLNAGELYSLVLMGGRGAREGWDTRMGVNKEGRRVFLSRQAASNPMVARGALKSRQLRGETDFSRITGRDVAEYFMRERVYNFKAKGTADGQQ